MNERFLAFLELKQDFLFSKIPKEMYGYYIDESLHIGRTYAASFKGKTIQNLIEKSQISVEVKEDDGSFFNVKLRAQFEFDPKGNHKIFIYRQSMDEYAQLCGISQQAAMDIHLAHEYFHYLEFVKKRPVPETLNPVVNYTVFKKKKMAHINKTSEIAAHAFTKSLLALEYFPTYFDFQYLINTKKLSKRALQEWELEFNRLHI